MKLLMIKYLLFLFLFLFPSYIFCQELINISPVIVNLHLSPDSSSKVLAKIAPNKIIQYENEMTGINEINGFGGRWIKVKFNETIGWVFDSNFIESKLKPPFIDQWNIEDPVPDTLKTKIPELKIKISVNDIVEGYTYPAYEEPEFGTFGEFSPYLERNKFFSALPGTVFKARIQPYSLPDYILHEKNGFRYLKAHFYYFRPANNIYFEYIVYRQKYFLTIQVNYDLNGFDLSDQISHNRLFYLKNYSYIYPTYFYQLCEEELLIIMKSIVDYIDK